MSKFQFVAEATITIGIEVEAASLLEAMGRAREAGVQKLCHHCTTSREGTWSVDGDPKATVLVDLLVDGETQENFGEIAAAWAGEGHKCPTAPLGRCVYDAEDVAHDDCIYCHEPYERK